MESDGDSSDLVGGDGPNSNVNLGNLPPTTAGDYNRNLTVDAADFVMWRKTLSLTVVPSTGADGDSNGKIEQPDYGVWRNHFGDIAPPIPASQPMFSELTTALPAPADESAVASQAFASDPVPAGQAPASAKIAQSSESSNVSFDLLQSFAPVVKGSPMSMKRSQLAAQWKRFAYDLPLLAWLDASSRPAGRGQNVVPCG